MSNDVQVVVSNDVAPNPPAVGEAEANANRDALAVAEEEQADTATITARSAFDPGVSQSAQAITTVSPYKVFLPIVLKRE
jgi:hypothetical protein